MSKNCVFELPPNSKDMINKFNLQMVLSNERTSIYQNNAMRFSIDQSVVRVLIFNDSDILIKKLYNYFYGEKYDEL